MSQALRLRGRVNIEWLIQSIHQVINRHEALRTRFKAVESGAVQIIDSSPYTVKVESVGSEADLQNICQQERHYQFDLSVDRLCRIRLLKDNSDSSKSAKKGSYLLLVTLHHSISDAWSIGIFFKELTSFYTSFKGRKPPALPKLENPICWTMLGGKESIYRVMCWQSS